VFVSTSVNGKIGTATPQYVSSQLGAGAGRTSESLLFLASCKKGPMNAETPGNKGPMIWRNDRHQQRWGSGRWAFAGASADECAG
jgi:hypothetical protein